METAKKEKEKVFELPNTTLKLKPVKRVKGKNGEIHLKHEANFLFGNSKITISPEIFRNGVSVNPLTDAEREFFENPKKSGLSFRPGDLAVDKKDNNFWTSKEARVRLDENSTSYNLSNPMTYLKMAILRSNVDIVAMSPDFLEPTSHKNKKTYKYVFEPLNYAQNKKAEAYVEESEVYRFLFSIENNVQAMINVLTLLNPKKRVPANASTDFLRGELNAWVKSDIKTFSRVMKDGDLDIKAIIARGINANAIRLEGTVYMLPNGEEIGASFPETVAFLKDPENQMVLDKIKVKIEG